MRICLISAATVTDFGEYASNLRIREAAEHPPLGILTLAAILRQEWPVPIVLDLNRIYYDYLTEPGRSSHDFCSYAVSRVPAGFDLIGLSTICSSYPLTIRIAEQLKQTYPEAVILLGGPQASVVDVATLRAFPCVDLIVRGEADSTLPALLRAGLTSPALGLVPGITFRSGTSIVRNPEGPVVTDLDSLPFPAFDLLPGMESLPYFSLELGRGCPFACTFCSTNDFFRRRFRLKSPEVMLAQMRKAKCEYGAKSFDLVHDMFTVDRKRVAAFCQVLLDSKEHFRWGCSARTDCLDDALIKLMHRSGCRSVFFGVETGSPRLQRAIEKDLDLEVAASRIRNCTAAGIATTVSLITGFPAEVEEDMWQTVSFLMQAARYELVEPQLHIVAPLAGTPLYHQFRDKLLLDDVYSDISYQGWWQDQGEKALIASFPDVFPNFYGLPAPALDRLRLKHLRVFVLRGLESFQWIMGALHQSRGGIQEVFENWEAAFPALTMSSPEWEQYYASNVFRTDFTDFVRSKYLRGDQSDGALEALLKLVERSAQCRTNSDVPAQRKAPRGAVPLLCKDVRMIEVDVDLRAVFESLRRGDGLPRSASRRMTIALRSRKMQATDIMELTPLSASFLKLCEGRSLDQIVAELELPPDLGNLSSRQAAALISRELCRQRLITLSPRRAIGLPN